ncbi:uncharacterized protein [Triticum aestivum]|uniref:uncharacterized protein isoform X2 n=1 Tax=Triticum aestivum TaxID=4565 RepID=UPI001D024A7E|nr:uncharacterized protein LOC123163835 isoform X2 [Triticum aestivum]
MEVPPEDRSQRDGCTVVESRELQSWESFEGSEGTTMFCQMIYRGIMKGPENFGDVGCWSPPLRRRLGLGPAADQPLLRRIHNLFLQLRRRIRNLFLQLRRRIHNHKQARIMTACTPIGSWDPKLHNGVNRHSTTPAHLRSSRHHGVDNVTTMS